MPRFACIGDSITCSVYLAPGLAYPEQTQTLLGVAYERVNMGAGGREYFGPGNLIATVAQVAQVYRAGAGSNTALGAAGHNDLVNGRTAAQTLADAQTWRNAVVAGAAWNRVLLATILPTLDARMTQASWATLNAGIRALAPGVPICDFAADPLMGNWAPVTAGSGSSPVILTVPSHGIVNGTSHPFNGIGILADNVPYACTVVDANTLSVAQAAAGAFTSGGALNDAGNFTYYKNTDGVHPIAAGCARMAAILKPLILP